jgi:purine catabolism regulator
MPNGEHGVRLTLGDVLDQPGLGLQLRNGGDAARTAPVDGAHSVDHLRDPVRWLQEHWIMLTTGTQLRGRATAQRRLVAELCEGGITALGFGVGISHANVPRALLEEAERRAFPLFEVPLETPFREIISVVNRSALSTDLYVQRRIALMQRHLLDAAREPAAEQALVERLAWALGGADVAFVRSAGEPIAATGPDLGWSARALPEAAPSLREFEHAGRWGIVVAVQDAGAELGRLAALPAARTVTRQLARPLVRITGELLALVSATRVTAGHARQQRRARLGARLVRALDGETDAGLGADLAAAGLDFTRPCCVALLAGEDDAPGVAAALDTLEPALASGGTDVVVGLRYGRAVVLAQDGLAGLADLLAGHPDLAGLRAGVSEPVERLDAVPAALDQAALALTVALSGAPAPIVQRHVALEPSVALLGGAGGPARERLVGVLDPLVAEPRLHAAVVAYLDAGLDVGRAAHALGLHRNSLRYRLDRAEHLLGGSLRSPGTLATVHLALLAERLHMTDRHDRRADPRWDETRPACELRR